MKLLFSLILIITASTITHAQKPTTLNHIAVYVQDLQKSENFYINVIRLDTMANPFRDGKHTWFKIGEHSQLHLIAGATGKMAPDKNSHLCFSVASIENVITELKKRGIPYEDWLGKKDTVTVRPDNVKQLYIQDPDGYWIEINNDTF